jgi:hypothetical protein
MNKGILSVVLLGFLAASAPLFAQPDDSDFIPADALRLTGAVDTAPALALNRPDLFSVANGSLLIHDLPATVLLDGRRLNIGGDSGLGVAPLERIPLAFLSAVRVHADGSEPMLATDAPGGVVDLQLRSFASGGEVGVFYGKSGGKYGREDFQSYIVGGVGSDKFQISAGAAYEHSSGRGVSFSR